jgi:VCBS repeat-containing protein
VEFVDPEMDSLTYTASEPAGGSVAINAATGTFTYTPSQAARDQALATPQNDTDTFTITASDGEASTTTDVSVPVLATGNVAPAWQGYTANFNEATKSTAGTFMAVDADGGDTVNYSLVWGPWAGSVMFTPTGDYIYTPAYTGPDGYWSYDIFYVEVTDGHYTTLGEVAVTTYTQYCGEACAL